MYRIEGAYTSKPKSFVCHIKFEFLVPAHLENWEIWWEGEGFWTRGRPLWQNLQGLGPNERVSLPATLIKVAETNAATLAFSSSFMISAHASISTFRNTRFYVFILTQFPAILYTTYALTFASWAFLFSDELE